MRIVWSTKALRQQAKLEKGAREQVIAVVERYASAEGGKLKRLKGALAGQLRLRAGDWRIFIAITGDVLLVEDVSNRREAYRR